MNKKSIKKFFKGKIKFVKFKFKRLTIKKVKGAIPVSNGLTDAIGISSNTNSINDNYFKNIMYEFKKDIEASGATGSWYKLYKNLKPVFNKSTTEITVGDLDKSVKLLNDYVKKHPTSNKASRTRQQVANQLSSNIKTLINNINNQTSTENDKSQSQTSNAGNENIETYHSKNLKAYLNNIKNKNSVEINIVAFIEYLIKYEFINGSGYNLNRNNFNWDEAKSVLDMVDFDKFESFHNREEIETYINDVKLVISNYIEKNKESLAVLKALDNNISKLGCPVYDKSKSLSESLNDCYLTLNALKGDLTKPSEQSSAWNDYINSLATLVDKFYSIKDKNIRHPVELMEMRDNIMNALLYNTDAMIWSYRINGASIETDKENAIIKKINDILKGINNILDKSKNIAQTEVDDSNKKINAQNRSIDQDISSNFSNKNRSSDGDKDYFKNPFD